MGYFMKHCEANSFSPSEFGSVFGHGCYAAHELNCVVWHNDYTWLWNGSRQVAGCCCYTDSGWGEDRLECMAACRKRIVMSLHISLCLSTQNAIHCCYAHAALCCLPVIIVRKFRERAMSTLWVAIPAAGHLLLGTPQGLGIGPFMMVAQACLQVSIKIEWL